MIHRRLAPSGLLSAFNPIIILCVGYCTQNIKIYRVLSAQPYYVRHIAGSLAVSVRLNVQEA